MRNEKGQFIKGYTKVLSKETKLKISKTCKARGIGKWMRGRTLPPETVANMSKNNAHYWAGKKRGVRTDEEKAKISAGLKGHKASPNVIAKIKLLNKGKFAHLSPVWKEIKKSPLYQQVRQCHKSIEWRKKVFTRDDFKCTKCGQHTRDLNADHIKTFAQIMDEYNICTLEEALNCEELWNIKNGRTLCFECHRKTDTWGRKRKAKINVL
jgi:5-methylcytosine-specific restriction endonuclease McrA